MPWSSIPEELLFTHRTAYRNAAFPIHEKGQPLRLYTISGLNSFTSRYGLIALLLPLHPLSHPCGWRVSFYPAGYAFDRLDLHQLAIPSFPWRTHEGMITQYSKAGKVSLMLVETIGLYIPILLWFEANRAEKAD